MTTLRGENDNEDKRSQDARKIRQNVFVAVWVILLLLGAYWLLDALIKNNREVECYARGGHNCTRLEIPDSPR